MEEFMRRQAEAESGTQGVSWSTIVMASTVCPPPTTSHPGTTNRSADPTKVLGADIVTEAVRVEWVCACRVDAPIHTRKPIHTTGCQAVLPGRCACIAAAQGQP